MKLEYDYDAAVIGSGVAGYSAALAALERGLRVLMVDSAPTLGGSSRRSTGMVMGAGTRMQKERGITDDPEALYADYMNLNQWILQPSVAWRLCSMSGPTIDWLSDNGVEFTDLYTSGTEKCARGHETQGGQAIINALAGRISTHSGFDSAVNSRVERLMMHDGEVSGFSIGDDAVRARSTIIACGGLGANLELLNQWHPESFWGANGPIRYYGHEYAKGDAIKFGQQVDAQIVRGEGIRNMYYGFGGSYLPTFSLVVNQLGRRYHDETMSYAVATNLLMRQPGGTAYLIFDDALKQALQKPTDINKYMKLILYGNEGLSRWRSDSIDEMVAERHITKASSLAELAFKLGIPTENLAGTVARYNRLVKGGVDTDYFKDLKTATVVETAPFYAVKITQPAWALTGTGLRIDENAAVIHQATSEPIPGLFAAGEATGNVLGSIYFGSGSSLANCAVFGRIAGYQAAERAGLS